ncbi:adenylate kinase, partial [Haematococcus lacustris]
MAPKADPRNKGKVEAVPKLSLLESTFPIWSEVTAANAATAKETPDKFDDPVGLMLPPAAQPFLDAWKRPEELVQNVPNLPVVLTQPLPAPATEQKDGKAIKGAAPPPASRELDGKLWAGHNCFEWLVSVFTSVMSAHKALPQGDYLWELIHPKDPKDGTHMRPASGKYRVRLFIMDTWRTVVIDDRIPVDLFGRPLLVGSRPLQLWPLLLSKAVLKVMVAMRVLDLALPHQVPAFQLLTGWPQEDLLDPLSGVQLAGPSAVGRASLTQRLVSEFPDKFGVTVSHTTRRPREHE